MHYDPTVWPEHRYPAKNRRLRRHRQFEYTGSNTIALTECRSILADGSSHSFGNKSKNVHGAPVSIRNKPLRGHITEYIAVADRVNLDATEVARLYRERDNNGYGLTEVAPAIEINAGFRGAD